MQVAWWGPVERWCGVSATGTPSATVTTATAVTSWAKAWLFFEKALGSRFERELFGDTSTSQAILCIVMFLDATFSDYAYGESHSSLQSMRIQLKGRP
ncbi:hypothetical protein GCM10007907_33610 [Chitinimonas prasina]|uniref:Uncharacterized protein n=1 Tax=Chitinimonas prasina TaxID=1434937 RepID=A0ABQ5YHT8_9NEIS|nr:hypothetical protein GCM10007907_33610 [Chitinimonas prasina]